MKKSASAIWQGSLKEGKGTISTQSGALDGNPYGFNTRFEGAPGTNPEELIGAAHAGCFSMALSMMLGQAGLTPERIETKAEVTLDKQGEGFAITAIDLQLKARVPGADEAQFQTIANQAKEGCPVSKLLNATITLSATLER
ncbi:OsmC family protein [Stutzerimonas urumqiensis]|uniref:OsmC family protein n=1 Tax=Stutzerimonas urumqiensis TaxID=638269 RepID=UPI003DA4FB46